MSSLTQFSGSVPDNYDKYLGPRLFEPYAVDLSQRIESRRYNKVLELASGTGMVTQYLLKTMPVGAELIATDLNNDMLEVAKARIKDERMVWQVVDAHCLPFNNDDFDLVVCQFGVMFFEDKLKAFTEAHRVLNKEGRFLFNTWGPLADNPASDLVQQVMDATFRQPPDFLQKGPFSFHGTDYIEELMGAAGFTDVSIVEVRKEIKHWKVEDYLKGFLDGTPLTIYLSRQNSSARAMAERELKAAILQKFGEDISASMLAYVVQGTKR